MGTNSIQAKALVLLTILFVLYAGNPQIFELKFFLNEVLSLIGFIIFLSLGGVVYKKENLIYNFVCIYFFYGFIYALIFSLFATDYYIFFRHTVVIYSTFVFFVGRMIYPYLITRKNWLLDTLGTIPFHPIAYLPLTVLTVGKWFGHRKHWHWIIVIWFLMAYLFLGQATVIIAAVSIVGVIALKIPRFLTTSLAVLLVVFLIFEWDVLKEVYDFFRGNDIESVMNYYSLLAVDGNTTVRLLMWLHVLLQVIPQHPFGIGLGTKLFSEDMIVGLHLIDAMKDQYTEYTLATHNSFVYLTARFGLPMLVILMVFYYRLVSSFKYRLNQSKVSSAEITTFLAFVVISVMAALNVVIESPIHSGMYWGLLGMYSAAVDSQQQFHSRMNARNLLCTNK